EFFRRKDLEVMDALQERVIPEEPVTDSTGRMRWVQTVKRPVVDQSGRGTHVLGVSTDITERRRLEDELRQAQKMEAMGRLAGGGAHDLHNLLTAIIGYAELARQGAAAPELEPMRRPLDEIRRAADQAATLTRQLLAFSRRQVLLLRVVDVNAAV